MSPLGLLVPDGVVLDQRCARCGKACAKGRRDIPNEVQIRGRNLCSPCYTYCRWRGTHYDWPSNIRLRDDLLDDYVVLRRQGYNWKECAEQLGMSYKCFERAMNRARKDNDPRAARLNERGYPR